MTTSNPLWDNLNNLNDNALEDMACPSCGSLGDFRIICLDSVQINDADGAVSRDYGAEWDEKSCCDCTECGHSATVAEFLTGQRAKEHWRPIILKDQGEEWLERIERQIKVCKTSRDTMYVATWSRDCDMCEGTSMDEIPASLKAFWLYLDYFERGLEGPGSCNIITEADAAEFKPESRDRAMEAFENGKGANAYSV